MRFPTTVLVLALSLSLCSGMLMRVNAGEPASVSRSDSLPPVKATQATSPAISVPAAMGFCCANGKVTASKAADCAPGTAVFSLRPSPRSRPVRNTDSPCRCIPQER